MLQLNQSSEAEATRRRNLEDGNKALREQVDKLVKTAADTEKLVSVTSRQQPTPIKW